MIVKGADVLISSAAKIARRYGVSTFVIGITVIAFGTSAPELAVGIVSGISGTNGLTLGNVIGSSFSNTALIIGIASVIMPLSVKDSVVKREIPMLIIIQLALSAMLFLDGRLSRLDSVILIAGFAAFMIYVITNSKKSMRISLDAQGDIDTDENGNMLTKEAAEKEGRDSLLKLYILSILSLGGLFLGGKLTVDSSTEISRALGLSETLIGLTVVALATTMPELITSIMAAIKKEPDIVLGNCIGSNIFNVLLVLGLTSLISPITVDEAIWPDIIVMLVLTLFVFLAAWLNKSVGRKTGLILLCTYVGYIAYKVISAIQ